VNAVGRVRAAVAAVLLGFVVVVGVFAVPAPATAEEPVTLTLYWGDGCPKCEAERAFLTELGQEYPQLRVEQFEVWKDTGNRPRFTQDAQRFGVDASAVPMTIVGQRAWIGFTDPIRDDIRRTVDAAVRGDPLPGGLYGRAGEGTCATDEFCPVQPEATVDVPLLGRVELGDRSLLVSTLVIGFVDGINPCSLWAISILLAIVIRTGSRRRVLAIGSTFLLVTAAMYALFMAGIYSALTFIGYLGAIQVVVGVVAGIFGLLAVADYFRHRRGVSLGIPDRSKPGLYRRMREAAGAHSLPAALAATTLLAVGVSLLETPCTAGFPVLWTGLLASHGVGFAGSALLFGVYMLPFLLDEFVVFGVAVATMRAAKLQEKHGRLLKLVAGTVMLALAGTMVFFADLMEDVVGATAVFALAIAAAVAIHTANTRLTAHRGTG
jgi:hypothetical protein